jgi:hypothetical protein
MLAIPSPIITKTHPALGSLPSRNKPIPLELIRDPPDFGIDSFDVLDMSPGPSSVLRVRRCGPCLALKCLWSGAFAPVEFTAGAVFDGRVLAECSLAGLCAASPPWPIRPEPGCKAGFSKRLNTSLIH